MTREMIKQIERDYWAEKADPIDMAEIFDLAIKALEQEPTTKKDLEVTSECKLEGAKDINAPSRKMTREEVLDWLYRLKSEIFVFMPKEWMIPMADALDVGIKALEHPEKNVVSIVPCGDAISRKAVEDITWQEPSYTDALNVLSEVRDKVRALPTVYPKNDKPSGKWIPASEKLPDTDDEVLCWYEYYHWSQEKVLPEYGIGRYFKETSAWFGEVANGKDVRVIAWMPLPEPYEPQESDDKE